MIFLRKLTLSSSLVLTYHFFLILNKLLNLKKMISWPRTYFNSKSILSGDWNISFLVFS